MNKIGIRDFKGSILGNVGITVVQGLLCGGFFFSVFFERHGF